MESKLQSSTSEAIALEEKIFGELCELVTKAAATLSETAHALASVDVLVGLAQLAIQKGYIRPVVNNSMNFKITQGRHPMMEYVLQDSGGIQFIPNNCDLSDKRFWIIT